MEVRPEGERNGAGRNGRNWYRGRRGHTDKGSKQRTSTVGHVVPAWRLASGNGDAQTAASPFT